MKRLLIMLMLGNLLIIQSGCSSNISSKINSVTPETNYKSHASKDSASASNSSAFGACGAWAGPSGANSTCAHLDGKGVTTGVDKDSAQGVGKNSN